MELSEYKVPFFGVHSNPCVCADGLSSLRLKYYYSSLCNMVVQLMQTFTWKFQVVESADESILASLASPFAYLLIPIVGVMSCSSPLRQLPVSLPRKTLLQLFAVTFVGLENLIDAEEFALWKGQGWKLRVFWQ